MSYLLRALSVFSVCISALSCNPNQPKELEISNSYSQASPALFKQLQIHDSLLFNIGFNECNVTVFDTLVANDFEFYHDQSGITPNKTEFINGTKSGLCNMNYKAIRKLEPGSLSVFPMYSNGELYGALQSGFHSFYALYPDDPELQLTSEARFTHLWLKEGDQWKLARVLSFDHHTLEE